MKFTFRKLRNQDGAAGSSPAPAPAPAAPAAPSTSPAGSTAPAAAPATPAPVAVQGQEGVAPGQSPAPAPAPGAFVWPDPNVDPAAWNQAYDNASDEERDRWHRGEAEIQKGDKTEGDTPAVDPAPAGEVDISTPLTAEEVAGLPPRVKAMLEAAQATIQDVAQYDSFLNPDFQQNLTAYLSDPVIHQRILEMEGGAQSSAWLDKALDFSKLSTEGLDAKDLDILGHDLDPEGVGSVLSKYGKAVAAKVEKAFEAKFQLQAAAAEQNKRQVQVLERQFGELASSVAALRSDKPIDSPEHPINGYRDWVIENLAKGAFSFEFVEQNGKELYATFAGRQQGGLQNLVQKPTRNLKLQILGELTNTARAAAVTSYGQTPAPAGGSTPSMVKHGIDGARFLNDQTYNAQIRMQADNLAMQGDLSLLRSLERLEQNKTW